MRRILPFFILLLSFISCNSLSTEEKEIKSSLGKSVETAMFSFIHEGNRLIPYDEFRAIYRHISLVYLEDGCRPCYHRYMEWQTRMDTLELKKDYTVLFIIRGQSYDRFLANLLQNFPDYNLLNDRFHVVMDDNSMFQAKNPGIPRWILDKSLLIDGEGIIRLIGHPFSSPRMLELFNDICSK
jgi:hypothetical protein